MILNLNFDFNSHVVQLSKYQWEIGPKDFER